MADESLPRQHVFPHERRIAELEKMQAEAFRLAIYHQERASTAEAEVARLTALINTPHTNSFLDAVRLEAAHQRERWSVSHDAGKTDADWYWLLAHLAGKAINKPEKLLHHIVTTAAACLNWHMARTVGNDMRPGTKQRETA